MLSKSKNKTMLTGLLIVVVVATSGGCGPPLDRSACDEQGLMITFEVASMYTTPEILVEHLEPSGC